MTYAALVTFETDCALNKISQRKIKKALLTLLTIHCLHVQSCSVLIALFVNFIFTLYLSTDLYIVFYNYMAVSVFSSKSCQLIYSC